MLYLKTNFWVKKVANDNLGLEEEELITRGQIDLASVESFIDITDVYPGEKLEQLGFTGNESIIQITTPCDDYVVIHDYDDLAQMWAQTRRASIYFH